MISMTRTESFYFSQEAGLLLFLAIGSLRFLNSNVKEATETAAHLT